MPDKRLCSTLYSSAIVDQVKDALAFTALRPNGCTAEALLHELWSKGLVLVPNGSPQWQGHGPFAERAHWNDYGSSLRIEVGTHSDGRIGGR